MDDDTIDRHRRRGWTINKEVSVGDVVAILCGFCAALAAYFSMEAKIEVQQAVTQRIEKSIDGIQSSMDRLSDKLDYVAHPNGHTYHKSSDANQEPTKNHEATIARGPIS